MTLAAIFLTISYSLDLPPGLLSAVCWVESNHVITAVNKNDNGSPSIGVCQIKEETARSLGYKGKSYKLIKDPKLNASYAGKYLKHQLSRYHGDIYKTISAFNAGSYRHSNKKYVDKVFRAWIEGR